MPLAAYYRPRSLAEALDMARQAGADAAFIAGGTDLLVDCKGRRIQPACLISLRGIADLRGITRNSTSLKIGALTTVNEIRRSAEVRQHFPALAEAAQQMAGEQVRNCATLGGNFCGAVPCADLPPSCICADGIVELASVTGTRHIRAAEFFKGARQTVRQPGEIFVSLSLPIPPPQSGAAYQRFSMRGANALPVAAVAARVDLQGDRILAARITLGAVAPLPWPAVEAAAWLTGQPLSPSLIQRAAKQAAAESRPITDVRATIDFRRHLVGVLTERALNVAIQRAKGG